MKSWAYWLNTIYLFGVIGALPSALADLDVSHAGWWAACAPLWAGVWWRDWVMLRHGAETEGGR